MAKRGNKTLTAEGTLITARMLTTYHERYVAELVARLEHIEKLVAELLGATK